MCDPSEDLRAAAGGSVQEITSQHGLLVLGSADEPADALNHLTLGLHLLVFALLGQEHDWQKGRTKIDAVSLRRASQKVCEFMISL